MPSLAAVIQPYITLACLIAHSGYGNFQFMICSDLYQYRMPRSEQKSGD